MHIYKHQRPVFIASLLSFLAFTLLFLARKNYEFVIYIGVLILLLGVVIYSNKKMKYPTSLLWMLWVWAILHMSGGGFVIKGDVLYNLLLINLVGEPYMILKFDQVVHIFGFFVATLIIYHLLRPLLQEPIKKWVTLGIVIIAAGLGLGALNEIIEFMATVLVPNTNVGGYINTSLDLVSDIVGAALAFIYIFYQEKFVKKTELKE